MAVKKNATSKTGGAAKAPKAAKKGVAKKVAAPKQTAVKAKPPVASGTSTKVGTPRPGTRSGTAKASSPAAKKVAPKAAAVVKLTDRQKDFLKTISAAKEQGYTTARKAEQKTIDVLLDRKLIKRGAKDKQGGGYCYLVSKAGEKHLTT